MASFYTYINCALNICSGIEALNSELNYLKAVAVNRFLYPTVIDTAVRKLKNPYCLFSFQLVFFTSSVVLFFFSFPNSSFCIAKILKQFNFKDFFFLPLIKYVLAV